MATMSRHQREGALKGSNIIFQGGEEINPLLDITFGGIERFGHQKYFNLALLLFFQEGLIGPKLRNPRKELGRFGNFLGTPSNWFPNRRNSSLVPYSLIISG